MDSDFDRFILNSNNFISTKKYIISKNRNNNGSNSIQIKGQYFDILSSLNEVMSHDFDLVDENYFSNKQINDNQYKDKHVFNFEIENKNYILFPNDNSLCEIKIQKHNGSPSQFPAENPNSKNKVENKPSQELMKNRIKNLIQFFKEEKDIFTLFEQNININNEKDMKDYYLINKNWIRFYEEKNNYKKIEEKLKLTDISKLNNEEFLNNNFNEISNEIKDLPENFLKVCRNLRRGRFSSCS